MSRVEVLVYMQKNIGKRFKLEWWADYMFFFFNGKNYISGGGETIDIHFLLDGEFVEAKDDDRLLGGLFDFS